METDNRQQFEMGPANTQPIKQKSFFFQKILNIWSIYEYLSVMHCTKLRYVLK